MGDLNKYFENLFKEEYVKTSIKNGGKYMIDKGKKRADKFGESLKDIYASLMDELSNGDNEKPMFKFLKSEDITKAKENFKNFDWESILDGDNEKPMFKFLKSEDITKAKENFKNFDWESILDGFKTEKNIFRNSFVPPIFKDNQSEDINKIKEELSKDEIKVEFVKDDKVNTFIVFVKAPSMIKENLQITKDDDTRTININYTHIGRKVFEPKTFEKKIVISDDYELTPIAISYNDGILKIEFRQADKPKKSEPTILKW